jgi:SAM-dependent methyltransferase
VTDAGAFWEDRERVEEFAGREPDLRLLELLDSFEVPGATRVLDLGCAGGRNTVVLAERGFDVQAIDFSLSMVARTRDRVATMLGADEAERRVRIGRMEDLGDFVSGSFLLVVALGVYHNAVSEEMWERALRETARVLAHCWLRTNWTPRWPGTAWYLSCPAKPWRPPPKRAAASPLTPSIESAGAEGRPRHYV